jgi:peroxiredoxin
MLKVGDKAPNFKLLDTETNPVELSSFKGKNVVLLFFPFANTGVCTKELCTFRDSLAQYNNLNAQVLAVSVDSPFSLGLWKEQQRFNFPLLSDFNKEAIKAYDTIFEVFGPGKFDFKGVAKRSAFVIDKDGIIRYAEVLPTPGEEPNYTAVSKALEGLS